MFVNAVNNKKAIIINEKGLKERTRYKNRKTSVSNTHQKTRDLNKI